MTCIVVRYGFEASYRPPDKCLLRAIVTDRPKSVAISEVMECCDAVGLHGALDDAVGKALPNIIIRTHASKSFFPKSRPLRKIEVEEMNPGIFGMSCDPRLDSVAVALARQNPKPISLPSPGSQA